MQIGKPDAPVHIEEDPEKKLYFSKKTIFPSQPIYQRPGRYWHLAKDVQPIVTWRKSVKGGGEGKREEQEADFELRRANMLKFRRYNFGFWIEKSFSSSNNIFICLRSRSSGAYSVNPPQVISVLILSENRIDLKSHWLPGWQWCGGGWSKCQGRVHTDR